MVQPPSATGFLLIRRCTTVPQSVSTSVTLSPSFFSAAKVISPNGWIEGKSVGLMMTIFSPLYFAASTSFFAAAKSGALAIGSGFGGMPYVVPMGKKEWQTVKFFGLLAVTARMYAD